MIFLFGVAFSFTRHKTPFFDFFYCTFLVYLHFVMYIIDKVCKKIKTNSRSIDREQ